MIFYGAVFYGIVFTGLFLRDRLLINDLSSAAGKAQLPPGFVDDDRDSIGKIKTAALLLHRQAQHLICADIVAYILWQTTSLWAK